MSVAPDRLRLPPGRIAAGAIAIALCAVAAALATDQPTDRLINWIEPLGIVGLLAASLLAATARSLRGIDARRAPTALMVRWLLLRLALLVAIPLLLIASGVAWATGLGVGPALVQALLFSLVAGSLTLIASTLVLNIILLAKGP